MQQRNYEDELTHHTHQQNGTESQFHDAYEAAVDVASAAHPDWEDRDPSSRTEVFTTAADLLRDRKYEFAAALSLENGKNRTEAMADVDEAIDSSSPTASRIPIGS